MNKDNRITPSSLLPEAGEADRQKGLSLSGSRAIGIRRCLWPDEHGGVPSEHPSCPQPSRSNSLLHEGEFFVGDGDDSARQALWKLNRAVLLPNHHLREWGAVNDTLQSTYNHLLAWPQQHVFKLYDIRL